MSFISLIQAYPKTSVIIAALIVSLFVTLITKWVTDQKKMKEIKEKQKSLQAEMKLHKENPAKMAEIQKEMFSHMGESMKHSLKPTIITMIPLLLFFYWARGIFLETSIASSWIWYYIIASIGFSIILRKVFDLA